MELAIYATCPQSKNSDRSTYLRAVADAPQWSEGAGCTGILVYTDNGIVDSWLVSQIIVKNTDRLTPEVLMSGSSPAGLAAARSVGALPVKYPGPPGEEQALIDDGGSTFGVRVGIIARDDPAEAWAVADERFPEDRQGKIMHRLAMQVSDSHWHRQLSARQGGTAVLDEPAVIRDPYWLGPFQSYNTFCPYLVGSYDQVGELLTGYMRVGCRTFILDIPPFEAELGHTMAAFDAARRMVAA